MPIVTSSKLPAAMKCIGSVKLPKWRSASDKASVGTLVHRCLERRAVQRCFQASYDAIDVEAKKLGLSPLDTAIGAKMVRAFKWMPPENALVEVSRAMTLDGKVETLVREQCQPGNYDVPKEYVLAGTHDVEWMEGTTLWVADYKTGDDANVTPVEHNAQVWANALMAANAHGSRVTHVVPCVIFVDKVHEDGLWEVPDGAPFKVGSGEFFAFEVRLMDFLRRAEAMLPSEVEQNLVGGAHCEYCPSIHVCPRFLELSRNILTVSLQDDPQAAAENYLALRDVMAKLHVMMKAWTDENGPIVVGDKVAWGPNPKTIEEVVWNENTLEVLTKVFGDAKTAVQCACTSKSRIYEQAKQVAKATGQKASHVNRQAMDALEAKGLIEQETQVWYSKFRTDAQDLPF